MRVFISDLTSYVSKSVVDLYASGALNPEESKEEIEIVGTVPDGADFKDERVAAFAEVFWSQLSTLSLNNMTIAYLCHL